MSDPHPFRDFADRIARGVRYRVDDTTMVRFADNTVAPRSLDVAMVEHRQSVRNLGSARANLPESALGSDATTWAALMQMYVHEYARHYDSVFHRSGVANSLHQTVTDRNLRSWLNLAVKRLAPTFQLLAPDLHLPTTDPYGRDITVPVVSDLTARVGESLHASIGQFGGELTRDQAQTLAAGAVFFIAMSDAPDGYEQVSTYDTELRRERKAAELVSIHAESWHSAIRAAFGPYADAQDAEAVAAFFGNADTLRTLDDLRSIEREVLTASGSASLLANEGPTPQL